MAELESQIAGVYWLAGLRIVSDLPLSGLPVCRDDPQETPPRSLSAAPLSLRSSLRPLQRFGDGQYIGRYNGREVLIDIPATGRFLVRGRQRNPDRLDAFLE